MKNKKGFTLIELLVVIAIIGLLASIVAVAVNSARKKARNARRNSDIKQLTTALNMVYDEQGSWPITSTWRCVAEVCYGNFAPFMSPAETAYINLRSSVKTYLSKLPVAPNNFGGYAYNSSLSAGLTSNTCTGSLESYSSGVYLYWELERPSVAEDCAPGRCMDINASGNYTLCFLKLE